MEAVVRKIELADHREKLAGRRELAHSPDCTGPDYSFAGCTGPVLSGYIAAAHMAAADYMVDYRDLVVGWTISIPFPCIEYAGYADY